MKKFHIISAAHVTHPFKFPKLYPKEFPNFLSFLNEEDVKFSLQVRELETGQILENFPMSHFSYKKLESDLVIGHVEDEDEFLNNLKNKYFINLESVNLMDSFPNSSNVQLLGHDFTTDEQDGRNVLVPVSLNGKILALYPKKLIIDTVQPSIMVFYSFYTFNINLF